MYRLIVVGVVVTGFCVVAFMMPFLFSGGALDTSTSIWNVSVNNEGAVEAFNITPGKTTLAEAIVILGDEPVVSLFQTREKELSLEASFASRWLGGITGVMVLSLDTEVEWVATALANDTSSGSRAAAYRRIPLEMTDLDLAQNTTVTMISVTPGSNLEIKTMKLKFGEPDGVINREGEGALYRYSDRGIFVTLNERGNDLIQIMQPSTMQKKSPGVFQPMPKNK